MGLLLLHQKLHVCLLLLHCALVVLLARDQALRSTGLGQAPLTLERPHWARGLGEAATSAHHTMRHTGLVGLLLLLLLLLHHCLQ